MLEYPLQNVTVQIDYTWRFYMVLPENNDFYQTDLSQNKEGELERSREIVIFSPVAR